MKCKLKNIEIYYEIYGSGKPILMLHGRPVDHRLMKGCMEPLFNDQDGYKRIYFDLPGMGKTKGEKWIKNLDMLLDVVIDFINEIIPSENFLLAGESYGGLFARGLIYKMSNRIDGLLLICPAIFVEEKKRNVPLHKIIVKDENLLSQLDALDAQEFCSIQVVQNKHNWERFRDEILCAVKIADLDFIYSLDAAGFDFSFSIADSEINYDKPTLILLGRQDNCVGYKDAWDILDKYPRATFAVLDKAGHNLQIEQSDLFNYLVREWLTRVSEN